MVGPPLRLTVPLVESWMVDVWLLVGVMLTVPPEPLKSSPPIALVNVPVDSVPAPLPLPIVTIDALGIALSTPSFSVPP